MFAVLGAVACGEEPDPDGGGDGDADGDADGDSDTDPVDSDTFDLDTLAGKTYLIKFDKGYWTTPPNVGEEVGSYVPGFLMQITAVDKVAGTFTGILGTADENDAQNTCNKTASITGTLTADAKFSVNALNVFEAILSGPEDSETGNAPETVAPIHDFSISGTFDNQGDRIAKGEMNAVMDFRDIDCLFALISNPDDRNAENICELMSNSLGYDCETCPFEASTALCVSMKAELFKSYVSTETVTEVADFDMSCVNDADCQ